MGGQKPLETSGLFLFFLFRFLSDNGLAIPARTQYIVVKYKNPKLTLGLQLCAAALAHGREPCDLPDTTEELL